MDYIGPLQQMTPQVLASDAHLFTVQPVYRFRLITAPSTPGHHRTVGENPEYGASINYYLKAAVPGPVTLTILDAKGHVVRTLTGTGRAGLNRVNWDLRGEPSKLSGCAPAPCRPRRTSGWGPRARRPPAGGGATISILQPPGTYTVELSAGGRELDAAPHRAQGSAFSGHRGRHRGADADARRTAPRSQHGGGPAEPYRTRAEPDRVARAGRERRGGEEGRCRTEPETGRPRDAADRPADHPRPGRHQVRGQARSRGSATSRTGCRTPISGRRTSTWRSGSCWRNAFAQRSPTSTQSPAATWRRSTRCCARATSRTSWLGAEPAAWRQSMNLSISSTGRRSWSPPGGAAGTPTATSAASCSGASTPSRPSRASRAMSGLLSQHDP